MLYQDAIDSVLSIRTVAPKLFFEGSELMRLAEQLLAQAEALPAVPPSPSAVPSSPSAALLDVKSPAESSPLFSKPFFKRRQGGGGDSTRAAGDTGDNGDGDKGDVDDDDDDDRSPLVAGVGSAASPLDPTDQLSYELRLFYDLHTIPEADSLRESSSASPSPDRPPKALGSVWDSPRHSRESREMLPDDPGSARGSYDSDE
jgi:hypothetical protein